MNHSRINLRLESRNEGKIKSYESCRDLRAWNHDIRRRSLYLREWIKADMPISVIPTGTLTKLMMIMTCRSRSRVPPRCHPDCKSKVVLESICNSCHAMKRCLKNEEQFEKYFTDEDFETSHWPCERCLEALKTLKMFWKIILEKIFHITIPKEDDQQRCCGADGVRTVSKRWQSEMTQQAMFVKNISYINHTPELINSCIWEETTAIKETVPGNTTKNDLVKTMGKTYRNINVIKSNKVKSTDTDCLSNPLVNRSKSSSLNKRRNSRRSTTKAEMIDAECECDQISEEINHQKTVLLNLEEKCNSQKQEITKLKKDNSSLRIELQNVYNKNTSRKTSFFTPSKCTNTINRSNHDSVGTLPKALECYADDCVNTIPIKGVESEMIITMKSGKNENYGHISLLQVLHKTNCPDMRELNMEKSCSNRKEDPIELLTKVQHTFGAIVKREIGLANKKPESKCDIDATFNTGKLCPSVSSSIATTLTSSDSVFVNSF